MVLNVHRNHKAYYRLIINFLVECCFTSTETVGLTGTGAQDGRLDFHTAPELSDNCYDDVGLNVLRCQADRIIIIFEILIYIYTHTHIFVDLVMCGVLSLVGEIWRYRNYRFFFFLLLLLTCNKTDYI